MKIGGVEAGPAEAVLVLPRDTSEDIIITCKAVLDMKQFESMCPEPKAKPILVAGGFKANNKDPGYLEQCSEHARLRFSFIALKSLEPSEIEWEKVDMNQPPTWHLWEQELRDAGLSAIEVNRVVVCVMGANSLDEEKLEKARESFLRGLEQARQVKSSGPDIEPKNTPSGEPVQD